jgi:hemerythrin
MSMFEWDQRYSVEIEEIDRQHQRLFELLNELYAAMQAGQAAEVIGKVLERVVDYTAYHFSFEEKLLSAHGYPDEAAHRAEHAALTSQAKALAERLHKGQGDVPTATLKFLYDWLARHILGSDKRYAAFLQKQGVA